MRRLLMLGLVCALASVPGWAESHRVKSVHRAGTEAVDRWTGLASWCGGGERLHRDTASGRRFNPRALEAAMWDVPFGVQVKVTNQTNGQSVIVRITDRGPARRLRGRVIDLTQGAFGLIAPLRQGLIPVVVERMP